MYSCCRKSFSSSLQRPPLWNLVYAGGQMVPFSIDYHKHMNLCGSENMHGMGATKLQIGFSSGNYLVLRISCCKNYALSFWIGEHKFVPNLIIRGNSWWRADFQGLNTSEEKPLVNVYQQWWDQRRIESHWCDPLFYMWLPPVVHYCKSEVYDSIHRLISVGWVHHFIRFAVWRADKRFISGYEAFFFFTT